MHSTLRASGIPSASCWPEDHWGKFAIHLGQILRKAGRDEQWRYHRRTFQHEELRTSTREHRNTTASTADRLTATISHEGDDQPDRAQPAQPLRDPFTLLS